MFVLPRNLLTSSLERHKNVHYDGPILEAFPNAFLAVLTLEVETVLAWVFRSCAHIILATHDGAALGSDLRADRQHWSPRTYDLTVKPVASEMRIRTGQISRAARNRIARFLSASLSIPLKPLRSQGVRNWDGT